MTSSIGNIFRVTGPFMGGNSPVTSEFPSQGASYACFDVFFDVSWNKRLHKQMTAGDFRRHDGHCDVIVMMSPWQRMTYRHLQLNLRRKRLVCIDLCCRQNTPIQYMWPTAYNIFRFHRYMMTSSNGNTFPVTGHWCGEFTGLRWIPRTKASDAELWYFLWSASE